MWRHAAIIALAVLTTATAAKAEQSVRNLLDLYDHAPPDARHVVEQAVRNTYNGISWSNSYLQTRGQKQSLYCPPDNVNLVDAQLIDMLRKEVQAHPDSGELPFGAGILLTAMRSFPCANSE